jgi:dihydrofolate synthase/folylpolyglutamate synthase
VALSHLSLSPQEWARLYRRDDGEQQPISAVERVFGLESQAKRYGLELMRPLMEALGHPERRYPVVHITGSKGKGSTAAMVSAALSAAGYRVGLYVSPSLTCFEERIQINGAMIPTQRCEEYVDRLCRILDRHGLERPKFFEAATAMAFWYFAEEQVDVAVVEVGLGGRRDATNVVLPSACIITSIELEHTAILGNSLPEIAYEKAGIIKPGADVVTGVETKQALAPIQEAAEAAGVALYRWADDFGGARTWASATAQMCDLWFEEPFPIAEWRNVTLSLPGKFQIVNAGLAVAALQRLTPLFPRLTEEAVRTGLGQLKWPGRLELRFERCPVLLDVAHTPASMEQLRDHLETFFPCQPRVLVLGLLRDKRLEAIADILADCFDLVIGSPVKWFRTMDAAVIRGAFQARGTDAWEAASIRFAVDKALQVAAPQGLVVVAGSVFAVGEAKRAFGWVDQKPT